MSQFVKHNESSHWYELTSTGEIVPQYDATLEARKFNYFISPTSIEKDIIANPALTRWIKNEIAKAFVSTPRLQGESDDSYAQRCLTKSDQISTNAREKGTAIHAAIEGYPNPPGNEYDSYYSSFKDWFENQFSEKISSEIMLANPYIGVAGRCDLIARHKELGPVIIDVKTQNVRKSPTFYDSFPRQLSFYAMAYGLRNGGQVPRIMSLIVDSNAPHVIEPKHVKLYTREEQGHAWREFLSIVWLWCRERDFWPGSAKEWRPVFPSLDVQ